MSSLAWLIPVALFLGLLGLAGFLWALRSGQYEDLEGAAYRILDDDEEMETRKRKPSVDDDRDVKSRSQ